MTSTRIVVTLESELVARLDQLVAKQHFASRSGAVQEAVREKLARLDRSRLTRECDKLDRQFERDLSELGMGVDAEAWPEY
jgi:metal-responsive CopG/Arc/MetJ family transcriptional regulator